MTGRRFLIALVALALLSPAVMADTGAQPVSKNMLLNGVEAPSGSTFFNDSVLATLDKPATVNLVNGQTLVVAPNSQVAFESSDSGDILVNIRQGSASYHDRDGIVVAALESAFLIANQGGVQQGEPMEEAPTAVPVCVLASPTDPAGAQACVDKPKAKGCSWDRTDAVPADLEKQGASFYEVDASFDCKSRKGWIAVVGGAAVGGMAAGSTAAIVSGAVLGSAVIIEEVDGSSSPTSPGG